MTMSIMDMSSVWRCQRPFVPNFLLSCATPEMNHNNFPLFYIQWLLKLLNLYKDFFIKLVRYNLPLKENT